jgi:glycosyltransferase involved in cell wall biosynthesis
LPYHAEYEVGSSRHKIAFDLYLAAKTLQIGRQFRPQVVHGHMHEGALIGGLLARFLRVPLVFDFQGSLTGEMVDHRFISPDGWVYPWARRLETAICRLPSAILTSSHLAEELLVREFRVPAARISPQPDCVDLDRFDPERFSAAARMALRQRLGIPSSALVVAYLGLLADYQGIPDLIQTAALLKRSDLDFRLLVMGYPRVAEYRAAAERAGVADRMIFTGKVPYGDAPEYLSAGDIAISAKTSSSEGSGKVLNYMAMSKPVVACDTQVHREYLDDQGVYAPVGDVSGLADGILALVREPARRQELGLRLRARASRLYSWEAAAGGIVQLYERLTGLSAHGEPSRSPERGRARAHQTRMANGQRNRS